MGAAKQRCGQCIYHWSAWSPTDPLAKRKLPELTVYGCCHYHENVCHADDTACEAFKVRSERSEKC